jgi:hypothetical protein
MGSVGGTARGATRRPGCTETSPVALIDVPNEMMDEADQRTLGIKAATLPYFLIAE